MSGFQSKRAMSQSRSPSPFPSVETALDILEEVQKYCDECGYDDGYKELQLQDLDYLAKELSVEFNSLLRLIRSDM